MPGAEKNSYPSELNGPTQTRHFSRARGDECALFLSEFKGEGAEAAEHLSETMRLLTEGGGDEGKRSLVEIVKIQHLIAEPVYYYTVSYNLICLKERTLRALARC